ncbi:MAG: HipA family kinase [Polyangiaceae bacterium]|nr:HipA family kinase [Polyangiaceae bacterium]
MEEVEEKSQVTTRGPDWAQLLIAAAGQLPPILEAVTFHFGPWGSASAPVCLKCSDGVFRVLKGQQAGGRMLFNDQVIARLAQRIGAPVPKPALVSLPDVLVKAEARLTHMTAGVCHGLEFLDRHSDRLGVAHTDLTENRSRFASLAVLYGWAHASDHQQIYPNEPPPYVWSVDHGHFVGPSEPNWTIAILEARGPAHVDSVLESGAALTKQELTRAVARLGDVSAANLAEDIAAAPAVWGVSAEEKIAFATYMWRRRDDLLRAFASGAENATAGSGEVTP